MGYKVTRLACPSCKGSGMWFLMANVTCLTCHGEGKVSISKFRDCRNWLLIVADSGYIDGTHSSEDREEMLRKAKEMKGFAASMGCDTSERNDWWKK